MLEELIALTVDDAPQRCEALDDRRGRDDEPNPEAGSEDLRERADVDDNAMRIGARERQDGATFVMELVVVVVLENEEAPRPREIEEPKTARGSKGHGRRILMMRCHVDA